MAAVVLVSACALVAPSFASAHRLVLPALGTGYGTWAYVGFSSDALVGVTDDGQLEAFPFVSDHLGPARSLVRLPFAKAPRVDGQFCLPFDSTQLNGDWVEGDSGFGCGNRGGNSEPEYDAFFDGPLDGPIVKVTMSCDGSALDFGDSFSADSEYSALGCAMPLGSGVDLQVTDQLTGQIQSFSGSGVMGIRIAGSYLAVERFNQSLSQPAVTVIDLNNSQSLYSVPVGDVLDLGSLSRAEDAGTFTLGSDGTVVAAESDTDGRCGEQDIWVNPVSPARHALKPQPGCSGPPFGVLEGNEFLDMAYAAHRPGAVNVVGTNLLTGRRFVAARGVSEEVYVRDPNRPETALIAGASCVHPVFLDRGYDDTSAPPEDYQLLTGVDQGPPKRCPVTLTGPVKLKASRLTLELRCPDGCASTLKLSGNPGTTRVAKTPSPRARRVSVKLTDGALRQRLATSFNQRKRCSEEPKAPATCRSPSSRLQVTVSTTSATGVKSISAHILEVQFS
jgi:hypothetical protein